MKLEIVILSEVSHTVKNKYHVIPFICGIQKKIWYKWTYLENSNRVTDVKNKTYGYQQERRREKLGDGIDITHRWDR